MTATADGRRTRDAASALEGIALSALGWAHTNRPLFALPEDVLDPRTDVNRTLKRLGELAQLNASIHRHSDPGSPVHTLASELLDFAWAETGEGALFLELARGEPFATYPMEIYAAFAYSGRRHPGYERFVPAVARTRGWRLTEQHPNRRLGVLNAERHTGLAPHGAPGAALRGTWLGGLPEPWTFERSAGYTLTHVVFHLTDWGRAPGRMPGYLAEYLDTWLPPWLDTCLDDDQWDLVGELLAVAASLPPVSREPLPVWAEAAWARLATAQDATGALPEVGPGNRGQGMPRDFPSCYHSTLVVAFAAALTLARLRGHRGQDVRRAPDRSERGRNGAPV